MHRQFRKEGADKDENKDKELDRFMIVQSAWDSKMAESAAEARNKYEKPVAVLAGGGHVEYGWGIAYRLLVLDPGAATLQVMPWRGDGRWIPRPRTCFYYCPETHASRLGFTLEARDKSALVVEVQPGSAAAKAGFAAGDILTAAAASPWTACEPARGRGQGPDRRQAPGLRPAARRQAPAALPARGDRRPGQARVAPRRRGGCGGAERPAEDRDAPRVRPPLFFAPRRDAAAPA
jgi:hypothetical protein